MRVVVVLKRGRLLHRLIQSLPDLPPENRAAAADDFLLRNRKALQPAWPGMVKELGADGDRFYKQMEAGRTACEKKS